jgi:DNA-directed RNA polymerase specialized sigma24 family protein
MRNQTAVAGFIFQVSKNKWLDQLRLRKIKQTISLSEQVSGQIAIEEMPQHDNDYLEKVKLHFGTLSEQCREILNRFYFNKESMKQIAVFFSWTEASAKNNKYRCLERLRNRVHSNN